jgi:hypothetical protein
MTKGFVYLIAAEWIIDSPANCSWGLIRDNVISALHSLKLHYNKCFNTTMSHATTEKSTLLVHLDE